MPEDKESVLDKEVELARRRSIRIVYLSTGMSGILIPDSQEAV